MRPVFHPHLIPKATTTHVFTNYCRLPSIEQSPCDPYVFTGSIDSSVVIACIDKFCKQLSRPTTLVIDNAPIHRSAEFEAMIPIWEAQGLFLWFLPPYSPELNLIEILWKQIKYHWMPIHAYESVQTLAQCRPVPRQHSRRIRKTIPNLLSVIMISYLQTGAYVLARYGGDEFASICCGCQRGEIEIPLIRILENIKTSFAKAVVALPPLSLSIGAAVVHTVRASDRAEDLIELADMCLYRAKDNGRDGAFKIELEAFNQKTSAPVQVLSASTVKSALEIVGDRTS